MNYGKNLLEYTLPFIKDRLGDLLSGLVFWLPIGVIILVGSYIYSSLEDLGKSFLVFFLPEKFVYPGFGIILWIIILLLTGLILRNTAIGDFLSRVPVLGIFFRRKGGRIITFNKLLGLTPCLFLFSPTCPSYGWILTEEEIKLNEEEAHLALINVYYPNVPSIVTGQIFPVRKETVIKLGNPSREIIDLLLYALRSPENIQYLPWEEEGEDEFKKRAKYFGLNLSNH
ncbi:hypothetical protein ACFLXX_04905 [Chloroflexota bacterium]